MSSGLPEKKLIVPCVKKLIVAKAATARLMTIKYVENFSASIFRPASRKYTMTSGMNLAAFMPRERACPEDQATMIPKMEIPMKQITHQPYRPRDNCPLTKLSNKRTNIIGR